MPKYLVNTPTFTPVSFAERIKPIDAYKQTYDKISEDEMKTTALLDMIPSMLDTTNEKDAALNQQYEDFRASMSNMVDNIASGNLRNMAADARSLKENYTKYFAKIPIAYNAKMEAIKNFKGGPDWLGDRPEYHPTSDYIGTTPTYFGMGANDVYKTGKDVMQGIAKSINNDLPWTRNPDLLNKYFTHVVEEGTSEAAVARFAQMLRDDAALYANVPLTDDKAFDYANRITQAMNSGYNSIVGMYHAENLNNPEERVKFKNAALAGMQAGSEYKITEKELQNPEMTVARRGSYSGGGSGSGSGNGSSSATDIDRIPFFSTAGTLSTGSNRLNRQIKKIEDFHAYAGINPNNKNETYYATDENWIKYTQEIENIQNNTSDYIYNYWKKQFKEAPIADKVLGSTAYVEKQIKKFSGSQREKQIQRAAIDEAVNKYLIKPTEKAGKNYEYVGLDNPYDNVNYGLHAKKHAAEMTTKIVVPVTGKEAEKNQAMQAYANACNGNVYRMDSKGNLVKYNEELSRTLLKDINNTPGNYTFVSNNQHGLMVSSGADKFFLEGNDQTASINADIKSQSHVYDFSKEGIENQKKATMIDVYNMINTGIVADDIVKQFIGNNRVENGRVKCVFNIGTDIINMIVERDPTGRFWQIARARNGQLMVQGLAEFAGAENGSTAVTDAIGESAIMAAFELPYTYSKK